MLDIAGSLQLLYAPHVRERDKALLRAIMVGGVWNGFLLGHARGEIVPCRFCGGFDGDGHLFWECPHSPLVQIRENPEFHDLIQRDKRTPGLGACFGMVVCLPWIVLVVGRLALGELLLTFSRLVLGATSHTILMIGLVRKGLFLVLVLVLLQLIRMCGRMVAWCVMRLRMFVAGVLLFLRLLLGLAGLHLGAFVCKG